MIWEVDENLDGCVDWEEFKLMFQRNITDTTGLEPFQLFNVIQFMMYDKDNSGKVTVDETMHMLYARYGKARLESVRQFVNTQTVTSIYHGDFIANEGSIWRGLEDCRW
jgi:Ca2+-binding EF-hand superfamily protein